MSTSTSDLDHPIRVILIEDEPLFRDLLKRACADVRELQVMLECSSGEAAIEMLAGPPPGAGRETKDNPPWRHEIDVAIVDIQLSGAVNGLQTAYQLREIDPDIGILVLSNHRWPGLMALMSEFDHRGFSYLLKSTVADFETLRRAICETASGGLVVDKALLEGDAPMSGPFARLTTRQKDILQLAAQGYSNAAIADAFHLSNRTVENHLAHIYRELEVDNHPHLQPRVSAVVAYLTQVIGGPSHRV